MDDAYSAYRAGDQPRLVPSAVLFLDVLGTQQPPGGDEDAHLERTHAAFARARAWGQSMRGATEITIATWFTDNLVMACPVRSEDGDTNHGNNMATAVDVLVMYAALHQLMLSEFGLFARGAITFGNFYSDYEFAHGRGLNEAYTLESKRAIYPRVILDPSARSKLSHADPGSDRPRLTTGDDSLAFVDYLRYLEFVTETCEQVDSAYRDHRDRIAENLQGAGEDVCRLQKYGWLASYHDDRAPEGSRVDEGRPPRRFPLL